MYTQLKWENPKRRAHLGDLWVAGDNDIKMDIDKKQNLKERNELIRFGIEIAGGILWTR
jgi:hypothetical protein